MKGEEGCRKKEVVHRVKLDAAHGGDDQHDEEEKEKGVRRKETDSARQRSRLKFFRHHHGDLVTGNQILVRPCEIPAAATYMFFRRRQRVVRKVDVFEVGLHLQTEVAHLRNIFAAKAVPPFIETL